MIVSWQGGAEATQFLERKVSLLDANWRIILINVPPTPTSGSYTDMLGTNAMQFYRIRAER